MRWAMMSTVLSRMSPDSAACTAVSFSTSGEAVASSSRITGASFKMARAMEMRCRVKLFFHTKRMPRGGMVILWDSCRTLFSCLTESIQIFEAFSYVSLAKGSLSSELFLCGFLANNPFPFCQMTKKSSHAMRRACGNVNLPLTEPFSQ